MQSIFFTPQSTSDLKRVIYACGLANILAFGLLVPLTFALAVVTPFGVRQSEEIAAFHRLLERFMN